MSANDAENRAQSTAEQTEREKAAGRTPASENPWYLLATAAGEQSEDEFDEERHARNRRLWNGWACQNLTEEYRLQLAAYLKIKPKELDPWDVDERDFVESCFRKNGVSIPDVDLTISLGSTFFDRPFLVKGFIFQSPASFSNCHFSKWAIFDDSLFIRPVEFDLVIFTDLAMRRTKFLEWVIFYNSQINQFELSSSKFEERVDIIQVSFTGHVRLQNTEFKGPVLFEKTSFSRSHFDTTKFFDHVCFARANFNDEVNFHDCEFHQSCGFQPDWDGDEILATRFAQVSVFYNCRFIGIADFRHVEFSQYASFNRTRFKDLAHFFNARFKKVCDFSDCLFEQPTIFRDALFKTHFPIFSGTMLHQVTIFTDKNECWPKTVEAPAVESRESLAIIRHTVGKQGRPEEEHYFYRREMAFAALIGSPFRRFPYWAFGVVSDYGNSLAKPVIGLGLVGYLGLVVYWNWLAWYAPDNLDFAGPFRTAAGFSVAQLFGFLGFTGSYFGTNFLDALPTALKVLAGFQTVAGVVLLFFLGLGLRNRFRLK